MWLIIHWLVISGIILGLPYLISNISVTSWKIALLVGACLMFINFIIKPIIKVLTLPFNFITFGLFSLILNAFFFWLPSTFINGFKVEGIKSIILGSIIVSIINWIFKKIR